MGMQFGKNYVVTGFGAWDGFLEDEKFVKGIVVTPLDAESSAKYADFYALLIPEKAIVGYGWRGDFRVVSVPEGSLEYAEGQEVEPGNWITFTDVYLKEVK